MKTIDRIDKMLVGVELRSPMWHVLHILRMNAVQDEIAIQDAMEEIAEGAMEEPCENSANCAPGKCKWFGMSGCMNLYTINKHTGLEPMPHE